MGTINCDICLSPDGVKSVLTNGTIKYNLCDNCFLKTKKIIEDFMENVKSIFGSKIKTDPSLKEDEWKLINDNNSQ